MKDALNKYSRGKNIADAVVSPELYVTASYRDETFPAYVGNPYICAVQDIPTKLQLYKKLNQTPLFNVSQQQEPEHLRYQHIRGLTSYFLPLSRHIDFAEDLDQIIRAGYIGRNPKSPEFRRQLQENYERQQRGEDVPMPRTPPTCSSTSLIGISGGGKTQLISRLANLYPPVIHHPSLATPVWQIPVLVLQCPHNGRVSQLCSEFFSKVDGLLGTTYGLWYGATNYRNEDRVRQIVQICLLHGIGAIVLDELQHIKPQGKVAIAQFLAFFVNLVNRSVAPIIFVGTTGANSLIKGALHQARRSIGAHWKNYEFNDEFRFLIAELFKYQWTKYPVAIDDDFFKVFYDESQGVLDICVKLFMLSQKRAIATGIEKLSPNLMTKVARERLEVVRPMIEALASKNPKRIEECDDLSDFDFDELWEEENVRKSTITVEDLRRFAMENGKEDASEPAVTPETVSEKATPHTVGKGDVKGKSIVAAEPKKAKKKLTSVVHKDESLLADEIKLALTLNSIDLLFE